MAVGKRNESRLQTYLHARLIGRFGESRVVLRNLSQRGCCLEAMEPEGGKSIILQWEGFEAFGEVVWSHNGLVGIRFERALPYAWVIATRDAASATPPVCRTHDAREIAKAWAKGKRYV